MSTTVFCLVLFDTVIPLPRCFAPLIRVLYSTACIAVSPLDTGSTQGVKSYMYYSLCEQSSFSDKGFQALYVLHEVQYRLFLSSSTYYIEFSFLVARLYNQRPISEIFHSMKILAVFFFSISFYYFSVLSVLYLS